MLSAPIGHDGQAARGGTPAFPEMRRRSRIHHDLWGIRPVELDLPRSDRPEGSGLPCGRGPFRAGRRGTSPPSPTTLEKKCEKGLTFGGAGCTLSCSVPRAEETKPSGRSREAQPVLYTKAGDVIARRSRRHPRETLGLRPPGSASVGTGESPVARGRERPGGSSDPKGSTRPRVEQGAGGGTETLFGGDEEPVVAGASRKASPDRNGVEDRPQGKDRFREGAEGGASREVPQPESGREDESQDPEPRRRKGNRPARRTKDRKTRRQVTLELPSSP